MSDVVAFCLQICDVFQFPDGRTVFVGTLDEPNFIRGSRACDLLRNGVYHQRITIEGEMIPSPQYRTGFRSLSSTDTVAINPIEAQSGLFALKSGGRA